MPVDAHAATPRIGVLLAQLGTPDDPSPESVRAYLKEFLWDKRVVDLNRVLWWFILNLIILRTRPAKSAALYKRMHDNYGPVLLTYTRSLTQKLSGCFGENVLVRFGMRYGNPPLKDVLRDMVQKDGCDKILLVPLYPQYAGATTGSMMDAVNQEFLKWRWVPSLRVLPPYAKHPAYIGNTVALINDALKNRETPPERILLSYHGIPQRYVDKGDPYACMCQDTSDAIKAALDFPSEKILHVYQSRFGKEPWLQPYTDETIIALAKDGVKDILVATPSFTMDCLETLDEIGIENRHLFEKNGGERLQLVSCLNDHDRWVEGFAGMIRSELLGWV